MFKCVVIVVVCVEGDVAVEDEYIAFKLIKVKDFKDLFNEVFLEEVMKSKKMLF